MSTHRLVRSEGRVGGHRRASRGEAASISAVMVHSPDQPTVMRDTVFAVIMNIYFSVVVPLAVMSLIMPAALGGVIIAALVATPEGIGAVRSALANKLQRSVNICLGSLLATIGLTIPLMIVVAHLMGATIFLGLQGTSFVMLLLTLAVSAHECDSRIRMENRDADYVNSRRGGTAS